MGIQPYLCLYIFMYAYISLWLYIFIYSLTAIFMHNHKYFLFGKLFFITLPPNLINMCIHISVCTYRHKYLFMVIVSAFYNMKGGAQKSTLTGLFSSALFYRIKNLRPAVIDVDPQKSLATKREYELTELETNLKRKATFDTLMEESKETNGKAEIFPIHPIASKNVTDIKKKIVELYNQGHNFIMIDLPGSITDSGVAEILKLIHFIYLPVDWDNASTDTAKKTLNVLDALMKTGQGVLKDVSILFTKYTNNPKSTEYKEFNKLRKSLEAEGRHVYKEGFINSVHFRKEELYSTIFPFPNNIKRFENVSPYPLFKEIIEHTFEIIKKSEQKGKK